MSNPQSIPQEGYTPINPYTFIRLSPSYSKNSSLINILKSLLYLDNMSSTPQEIYMAMKSMNIHPPCLSDLCCLLDLITRKEDSPLVFQSPYYSINSHLIYSLPNRNHKLPRMNRSSSSTSIDSSSSSLMSCIEEDEDCFTTIITSSKEVWSRTESLKRKKPLNTSSCLLKSKRQRSQSLTCLQGTSEWLDFEDGDSKISCDYICSSLPLINSYKGHYLPWTKHLDSGKLKLQSCFLDCNFPVWTTVLENVKVYVSWIGECGLVNSSKQSIPILRRADNDMVNGTLLLHAAGLYSEQEKSIVLSLDMDYTLLNRLSPKSVPRGIPVMRRKMSCCKFKSSEPENKINLVEKN